VFNSLIEAMLGKTGTNLLVRLSSVILLCIGIEIIWSGTSNLIGSLRSRCGAAGGSLVPAVAGVGSFSSCPVFVAHEMSASGLI
jgi:hypothetical protein